MQGRGSRLVEGRLCYERWQPFGYGQNFVSMKIKYQNTMKVSREQILDIVRLNDVSRICHLASVSPRGAGFIRVLKLPKRKSEL